LTDSIKITLRVDNFKMSFLIRIKRPTRYINIQHLFCHKTPHVSGIFCAHHQELSTVRTAIGTFRTGYVATS